MEIDPRFILPISVFNIFFFWKFYSGKVSLATSELVQNFFPVTVWQGRQWFKGKVPWSDNIYYYEPGKIPFLSTFYPLQILISTIICKFSITTKFSIYSKSILIHYVLFNILTFVMLRQWFDPFTALVMSISFSYCGSSVKILTPPLVYTLTWIPGMLIDLLGFPGISLGMAILGGYWPVLIYFAPLALFMSWQDVVIGLLIGSIQIIPFLFYYPRCIRNGAKKDQSFGRLPIWKLLDAIYGDKNGLGISGVQFPEMCLYMGLFVPFLAITGMSFYVLAAFGYLLLAMTWGPLRIPARALHGYSFFMVLAASEKLSTLEGPLFYVICLIQIATLYLNNKDIYPHEPFAEAPVDLERFETENDTTLFPFKTGYYQEIATKGYTGGLCLKDTARRNNVTDPNGQPIYY